MFRLLLLAFVASATAFTVPATRAARSRAVMMADGGKSNNTPAKYAPKGPFGGYTKPGDGSTGWAGDQSKGTQIGKFERGEDYLFFQGPAPKTAIQEDLPSFFSPETITEAEFQGPLQILVTLTGAGSLFGLLFLLYTGA